MSWLAAFKKTLVIWWRALRRRRPADLRWRTGWSSGARSPVWCCSSLWSWLGGSWKCVFGPQEKRRQCLAAARPHRAALKGLGQSQRKRYERVRRVRSGTRFVSSYKKTEERSITHPKSCRNSSKVGNRQHSSYKSKLRLTAYWLVVIGKLTPSGRFLGGVSTGNTRFYSFCCSMKE